jgi:hypothetical protein
MYPAASERQNWKKWLLAALSKIFFLLSGSCWARNRPPCGERRPPELQTSFSWLNPVPCCSQLPSCCRWKNPRKHSTTWRMATAASAVESKMAPTITPPICVIVKRPSAKAHLFSSSCVPGQLLTAEQRTASSEAADCSGQLFSSTKLEDEW